MQNSKKISFALALGCTLLLASTAQAQMFKLSLGGSDAAVTDDSYDYVDDDPFLSLGQFGAEVSPVENLWLGLEYQWGQAQGEAITQVNLDTELGGAMFTARYEVVPLSFLAAYGRVGGGFLQLDMEADVQLQTYSQSRYIGVGEGAVGVEVFVPRGTLSRVFGFSRRSWAGELTVGLLLEAGYRFTGEAEFDKLERPSVGAQEGEPALEVNTLDLGTVDLSGVMMRSALTVSF